MFAIFTSALGDQSSKPSAKNRKANSKGNQDNTNVINSASKKRRKKPKKKKSQAQKGAGGNDDEDEDDNEDDEDELLMSETTVTKRIVIADLDQSNGLDPVEITIDEIVSRGQYPREKVATCVRSMWDRGLRYDDPEAVIKQLNAPAITTTAPTLDISSADVHDADKSSVNNLPEPQPSVDGVVDGAPTSCTLESTSTTFPSTDPAAVDVRRSTEADDVARFVAAAGQPHARAAVDGFYWWLRGQGDLAASEDPGRASRVELLLRGETLETLLGNALEQLRRMHAEATGITDDETELCASIKKLLAGLLVLLYSSASPPLVAALTRHVETLLGEFVQLPAGVSSASQLLAKRLVTVLRRAADSHFARTDAVPLASLQELNADVDALNAAVRDALAGAKEGNTDLPGLFFRRDLLSSRLQLQLDISDRLAGNSSAPSTTFTLTPAAENEELSKSLSPPPELTPAQVEALAAANDRRARLAALQTEAEECARAIREAQARQAEIVQRIAALQQEVALAGPEPVPARDPHATALVSQLTQLETLLTHGPTASSSAAGHGHSRGSETEAAKVAEFASTWAGTQAQCIAVLASRAAAAKKRVETLAVECQLYQSLSLKAIVVSTQAEISRLEKERSEDLTAISHLETEVVTLLNRVRLFGPATEPRTALATALHAIAHSIRSTGLPFSSGLPALLLAYPVISSAAPSSNGSAVANSTESALSTIVADTAPPITATPPPSTSTSAPKAKATTVLPFSFADSAAPTSSPAKLGGDRPNPLPEVSIAQESVQVSRANTIPAASPALVVSTASESVPVSRAASIPAPASKSNLPLSTKTAAAGLIVKTQAATKPTAIPSMANKHTTTAPTAAKNTTTAPAPAPAAAETVRVTATPPTRSWGKPPAASVSLGKSFLEIQKEQLAQERRLREAAASKKKAEAALLIAAEAEKAAAKPALACESEVSDHTTSCALHKLEPLNESANTLPSKDCVPANFHGESVPSILLCSQLPSSVDATVASVTKPQHDNEESDSNTNRGANEHVKGDDADENEKEDGVNEDKQDEGAGEDEKEDGAGDDEIEDGADEDGAGDDADEDEKEDGADEDEKEDGAAEDEKEAYVDKDIKGHKYVEDVNEDKDEIGNDDADANAKEDENEKEGGVQGDEKKVGGDEDNKEVDPDEDFKGHVGDEDVQADDAEEDEDVQADDAEEDEDVQADDAEEDDDVDKDKKGDVANEDGNRDGSDEHDQAINADEDGQEDDKKDVDDFDEAAEEEKEVERDTDVLAKDGVHDKDVKADY